MILHISICLFLYSQYFFKKNKPCKALGKLNRVSCQKQELAEMFTNQGDQRLFLADKKILVAQPGTQLSCLPLSKAGN